MTPPVFSSKQAAEQLGISYPTLNRYIDDPDIPLQGTLLTPRNRIFTQEEIDAFKQYMADHPNLGKIGRPFDSDAPNHGRHAKYHKKAQPVIGIQRVADGVKALVLKAKGKKRGAALEAINHFETLAWYPAAFADNCPAFDIREIDGAGVIFTGDDLFQTVIDSLAAYEQAVQE